MSLSANLKGFHRTDLQLAAHAFTSQTLLALRAFCEESVIPDQAAFICRMVIQMHCCVQPSSHVCCRCYTMLHATSKPSCFVVRILHVTDRRAKSLRRTWKNMCLIWSTMRLLAGTCVNSRHLATLHDCLLNNQPQRHCSACDCNVDDTDCQRRFSLKKL